MTFRYNFDNKYFFKETVEFSKDEKYNKFVLQPALELAWLVIGISYYKLFPDSDIILPFKIDTFQAEFLNKVYRNGLGQFAFENKIPLTKLPLFIANTNFKNNKNNLTKYTGQGIISLQSGGKDSLLTACLLDKNKQKYTALYCANSQFYPKVLNKLQNLIIIKRHIDSQQIAKMNKIGGLNGHIPITYIIEALTLIQTILLNKNIVLVSIGHEGEEPHAFIDNMAITHQWSKTWTAEKLLSKYVKNYISPNISIGSPLRQYSELKIAELFSQMAWQKYGQKFSSCNVANYQQKHNNSTLNWCGKCPKCANSFILFSAFIKITELTSIFNGVDLYADNSLVDIFKGLLGIDKIIKPFECVAETQELRYAYLLKKVQYANLPFTVPKTHYNYDNIFEHNKSLTINHF
ncbi:MAG: hypothetical protein LBT99_04500 [Bifidobacteriaceae bacterium]|nr:hypothetical protein [Bifidobacteriaceae bacterium]